MYELFRRILVDDLQMRADDIAPNASRAEVGLDSLTVVELSSVLRKRLGVEIADYELLELATVADIAAVVERRWLDGRTREPAQHGGLRPVLAWNESPYSPLPGIVAAITAGGSLAHRYPDPVCTELTQALARRYGVGADQVVVGAGSGALLQALFQHVAEPGAEVVYAWRSFEFYPLLPVINRVTSVRVPTVDGTHDLNTMADRITDATRLVLICNPNNPTGTVIGREELRAFLDRVPARCLVALDEAYVEFASEPAEISGLDLLDAYPNLVVLRTFSKAYGLAALRVGYLIGAAATVAPIRSVCLPYSVNAIAQRAALVALDLEGELLLRVKETVAERTRVRNALLRSGWEVGDSQGNFVWLDLGPDAALFGQWCERNGIAVRAFDGEGVRVTIGSADDNDAFLSVASEWCRSRAQSEER